MKVTTWNLEMLDRARLQPAKAPPEPMLIMRVEQPLPELNRWLYQTVGADWHWVDRLPWTLAEWRTWADRPELQLWIGYVRGTPAGYVELEAQDGGRTVELAYFGMLPAFVGKGFGGHFLAESIARAWDMGPSRVWVHTCSLDAPQALANYQKRGFEVFRVDESDVVTS